MGPHKLEKLFAPSSIAIFGASEKPDGVGTSILRNLLSYGYAGDIYPINPKHDQVQGVPCYSSIEELDNPVDLAVVAAPTSSVVKIIHQCGANGVNSMIINTAGFGECGDRGKKLEKTLIETARHHGIHVLGPNCLGLMRPDIGLDATFLDAPAPKGRLALVSQSGALCTAIMDWARPHNMGFSTVVSLGNASDIDFGDILDYLAVDSKTDAILLYVEGIHDSRSFMSGLRVAAHSKPVIVLKVGRHKKAVEAATTHTGAMFGSDQVFDAALERAGVVRAMTFGQLFAAAEILSTNRRVNGNNLAIVTNGGGPGILATDRAIDLGVKLPSLEAETIAGLDRELPAFWSHGNPVDILGDAPPERYGKAVTACLQDKTVDGVLTLLTPQAMTRPEAAAQEVVDAWKTFKKKKPVLSCWMGDTQVHQGREVFSANRIPTFLTPERAIEAFAYLSRYQLNQKMLLQTPGPLSDSRAPDTEGARLIIEAALSEGRSMLSDTESKAVLCAFHIRCTPTLITRNPTEALVAAESVGFPVAMKICSAQISHKSDVHGVKTNILSAPDVRSAFKALMDDTTRAMPDAKIDGVSVEPMASSNDTRELMVGVKHDEIFGPVIAFGAGGTMAEILHDSAVALPPLNPVLVGRLISRTRVSKLLGPFRHMPAINKEAVENVILRISEMVCELPHVHELDINPLLADNQGVIAVDARIQIRRPPTSPVRYSHMAIHPYPSELVRHTSLKDGTLIRIRPIRPEDADLLQEFVRNMSSESKYFRFMQAIEELTPEMLVRFTQLDYSREMAVIAVAEEGPESTLLGVARYTVNPDGKSCEFATAVSDLHRGQGIGSQLMQTLMEAARNRGVKVIEGEVLSDNHRMLSLMAQLGFSIATSPDDPGVKNVERWL
jgi:acetyltransferase